MVSNKREHLAMSISPLPTKIFLLFSFLNSFKLSPSFLIQCSTTTNSSLNLYFFFTAVLIKELSLRWICLFCLICVAISFFRFIFFFRGYFLIYQSSCSCVVLSASNYPTSYQGSLVVFSLLILKVWDFSVGFILPVPVAKVLCRQNGIPGLHLVNLSQLTYLLSAL